MNNNTSNSNVAHPKFGKFRYLGFALVGLGEPVFDDNANSFVHEDGSGAVQFPTLKAAKRYYNMRVADRKAQWFSEALKWFKATSTEKWPEPSNPNHGKYHIADTYFETNESVLTFLENQAKLWEAEAMKGTKDKEEQKPMNNTCHGNVKTDATKSVGWSCQWGKTDNTKTSTNTVDYHDGVKVTITRNGDDIQVVVTYPTP